MPTTPPIGGGSCASRRVAEDARERPRAGPRDPGPLEVALGRAEACGLPRPPAPPPAWWAADRARTPQSCGSDRGPAQDDHSRVVTVRLSGLRAVLSLSGGDERVGEGLGSVEMIPAQGLGGFQADLVGDAV